jgi:hypothetical protein
MRLVGAGEKLTLKGRITNRGKDVVAVVPDALPGSWIASSTVDIAGTYKSFGSFTAERSVCADRIEPDGSITGRCYQPDAKVVPIHPNQAYHFTATIEIPASTASGTYTATFDYQYSPKDEDSRKNVFSCRLSSNEVSFRVRRQPQVKPKR